MRLDDKTQNKWTCLGVNQTVTGYTSPAVDGSKFRHGQVILLGSAPASSQCIVQLQDSDDNSSFATVTAAGSIRINGGGSGISNQMRNLLFAHNRLRRYVRCLVTLTGTATLESLVILQQNNKQSQGTGPDIAY